MNKTKQLLWGAAAMLLALILAVLVGIQSGPVTAFVFFVACDLAVAPHLPRQSALFVNSLGTLSTGILLVAALEQAVKLRPALSLVTTDYSDEPAKLNDYVTSRVIGAASVQDFGTGAQGRTDVDAQIQLTGFKEVCHSFTAQEISSTNRQLIQESAMPIAEAIGDYFMDLLGALWASTTFTNTTTIASASADYTTLTGTRETLNSDARAVPKIGRFGVVNSDVYKALLEDPLCNRSQKVMLAGDDPVETGELVGIAGFKRIFEHPGLPSTNNTNGFFGTKSTTGIIVRPPRDPRDILPNVPVNANIGIVSIPDPNDPDSPGLSVMAIESIDALNLSATVKIAFLVGTAVMRAGFGQRWKTA